MILHLLAILGAVWLFSAAALGAFVLAGYLLGDLRPPRVPTREEANVIVHGSRHARNDLTDREAS